GVGAVNDLWRWDGTWHPLQPADASVACAAGGPRPCARDQLGFAHGGGLNLLVGGATSVETLNDTWSFDGEWSAVATATAPAGRFAHTLVFDRRRARFVMFGGRDTILDASDELWEWNAARGIWEDASPLPFAPRPPGRFGHAATFEDVTGHGLVFGGF